MAYSSEKKILVVDDEPDVRDFLSTCLEDAGFQVETACDGFDALMKVEQCPPDLITLDLLMPRISGIKLMRKIRKNPAWKEIPVVIVTAHAQDELGRKDLEHLYAEEVTPVPEHIIEKPITPSRLVNGIGKILDVTTNIEVAADRSDVLDMIKNCSPAKLREIQNLLS
jgi:CheY-like chemotaxis protein